MRALLMSSYSPGVYDGATAEFRDICNYSKSLCNTQFVFMCFYLIYIQTNQNRQIHSCFHPVQRRRASHL